MVQKGNRILTSIYLDPPVLEALRSLSSHSQVPMAAYLREAVEDLLSKHGVDMDDPGGKAKPAREVKYVTEAVRIWWEPKDKSVHVTAAPGSAVKLHTTFSADPKSERWHKSMMRWLSRVLQENGKPGPKVPE